jgi:hypothetical protein
MWHSSFRAAPFIGPVTRSGHFAAPDGNDPLVGRPEGGSPRIFAVEE